MLVILLTVFAVAPLFYPGALETQSGFLPAFNAEHLSDAPNWGRLPDPARGEGKLPYLLAWPFLQLSGSGIIAIKWGYGLAFVLGALGIFAWTRHWLGVKGGILAATVYVYLPWHLSSVYVRGAYAEAWLWAMWPLLLWAVDRLAERDPLSTLVGIAVGMPVLAATFWTQPGLAALFTPVLVAYHMILSRQRRDRLLWLGGAVAALLLALWFLGRNLPPALGTFGQEFLYPFQLLSAAWGAGPSFQLGLAAVGLTIVALALWSANRSRPGEGSEELAGRVPFGRSIWFWTGTLLVVVLLTLPISAFVWRATGFDRFLSAPWQLLALTGLPLAFLSGSVSRLDRRLAELPVLAGLVALVILASYPYLAPRFTQVDPGPEPVALFQPVEADAPQIMLLDYEAAPPTDITPTLTLTLTWQAIAPVVNDYTVFVHVLDQDGTKVAQRDSRPCDGECPTDTWQPGVIVQDRHQLNLPVGSPTGPYNLAVGLYLLETGQRASVIGQDDKTVILNVP